MKPPPTAASRLRRIHDLLFAAYGPQHWWPAQTPFEVVLGAYLVQNTSWQAAERAIAALRMAALLTVEGLCAVELDRLRELVRPAGFQTRKAPALKAFVHMLQQEFSASLEQLAALPNAVARRRLLALPGVGPETADAICLYALGHAVPVADEYLRRIALRHALLNPAPPPNRHGYDALVELTRAAFAEDPANQHAALYNEFHALVVAVGKAHCGRVARCDGCPLAQDRGPLNTVDPAAIVTKA